MRAVDIAGKVYGRLTVVGRSGSVKSGTGSKAAWECACECGSTIVTSGSRLRVGGVLSCGCLSRELQKERYSNLRKSYDLKITKICECGDEYITTVGSSGIVVRCPKCAKNKKRECSKKCRINNREKYLSQNKQRYINNRETILAKQRQYREKNKEEINRKGREYHIKHREELILKGRKFYKDHREEIRRNQKQYREENQEKIKQQRPEWYRKYRGGEKYALQKKKNNQKARVAVAEMADPVIRGYIRHRFKMPKELITKEFMDLIREELRIKRGKDELLKAIRGGEDPIPAWDIGRNKTNQYKKWRPANARSGCQEGLKGNG